MIEQLLDFKTYSSVKDITNHVLELNKKEEPVLDMKVSRYIIKTNGCQVAILMIL